MANVKVFVDKQTDKQNHRQTEKHTNRQAKNYMPPSINVGA